MAKKHRRRATWKKEAYQQHSPRFILSTYWRSNGYGRRMGGWMDPIICSVMRNPGMLLRLLGKSSGGGRILSHGYGLGWWRLNDIDDRTFIFDAPWVDGWIGILESNHPAYVRDPGWQWSCWRLQSTIQWHNNYYWPYVLYPYLLHLEMFLYYVYRYIDPHTSFLILLLPLNKHRIQRNI